MLVALAFGNLTTALYGFIAQVVCAYVTDMVLYGLDTAKVAYIISEKAHEISDSIVGQMDRGVTVLPGKGAYSGENKLVLMCAFKQKEIVNLKEIIFEIDPKAFIIVCDAHEVTGNGFKTYHDGADHRVLRHPESGLYQRDAPQRHAAGRRGEQHHPGGELPGAGERPDLPHRPGNRGGSHPL